MKVKNRLSEWISETRAVPLIVRIRINTSWISAFCALTTEDGARTVSHWESITCPCPNEEREARLLELQASQYECRPSHALPYEIVLYTWPLLFFTPLASFALYSFVRMHSDLATAQKEKKIRGTEPSFFDWAHRGLELPIAPVRCRSNNSPNSNKEQK